VIVSFDPPSPESSASGSELPQAASVSAAATAATPANTRFMSKVSSIDFST
jgi:hypothetical protein